MPFWLVFLNLKKAMVQRSIDCEESLKTLKEVLAQALVLGFADFALPFRV